MKRFSILTYILSVIDELFFYGQEAHVQSLLSIASFFTSVF